MKKALILLIVAVLLAVVALVFIKSANEVLPQLDEDNIVACTMDAQMCPDGSYVGRVPPSCEFAPCPGN